MAHNSPFASFAKTWDFEHLTSSPGNSKANGKAESGVKTAKHLLQKSIKAGSDPYLAFLDYRNTPTQAMTTSPVQGLIGRRTKTLLPTAQSLLMARTTQPGIEKSQFKERQVLGQKRKDLPTLGTLSNADFLRWRRRPEGKFISGRRLTFRRKPSSLRADMRTESFPLSTKRG